MASEQSNSRVAAMLNRKEVTQERQQRQYPPQGPSDNNPELVTRHLRNSARYLQVIAEELAAQVQEICVTDNIGDAGSSYQKNFPIPGVTRRIVQRTGNGFVNLAIPITGILVLPNNDSRIACSLQNSGSNAVILYLSDQVRPGVPTVYLGAGGGSWDGRFGNKDWNGNVFAVAQTGATTLCGGEF